MSATLKLHELTASPNSLRARVGLGYKGLEYERIPLEISSLPGDRSTIVAASRQPRLPLLDHGGTKIFDSCAILRYLEANFPETPRLFRDDYAEHGEIERWEIYAKVHFGEPIRTLFGQALAEKQDPQEIAKAREQIHERTGPLEDRLSGRDFLVGDHLTAADIACASPLYLADLDESRAKQHPIWAFFHEHLKLGDGRERTRAFARRTLAHEPVLGRR